MNAPTPEIVSRMREFKDNAWRWHDGNCRFCESFGCNALKYGVRHYVCKPCLDRILAMADAKAPQ